jgi:hypothetical protein
MSLHGMQLHCTPDWQPRLVCGSDANEQTRCIRHDWASAAVTDASYCKDCAARLAVMDIDHREINVVMKCYTIMVEVPR